MVHEIFKILKSIRDVWLVRYCLRRHKIGSGFHAGRGVVIWAKSHLEIGKNFYIGRHSQIECDATIGDDVIFGNSVALVGRCDHNYQQIGTPTRLASQIRDHDYSWKGLHLRVVIEDDVWVGYGAIILSGVKIARGSIVAAGSVVTKNVPEFCIVGGNPAKVIGKRFETEEMELQHWSLYKHKCQNDA